MARLTRRRRRSRGRARGEARNRLEMGASERGRARGRAGRRRRAPRARARGRLSRRDRAVRRRLRLLVLLLLGCIRRGSHWRGASPSRLHACTRQGRADRSAGEGCRLARVRGGEAEAASALKCPVSPFDTRRRPRGLGWSASSELVTTRRLNAEIRRLRLECLARRCCCPTTASPRGGFGIGRRHRWCHARSRSQATPVDCAAAELRLQPPPLARPLPELPVVRAPPHPTRRLGVGAGPKLAMEHPRGVQVRPKRRLGVGAGPEPAMEHPRRVQVRPKSAARRRRGAELREHPRGVQVRPERRLGGGAGPEPRVAQP